MAAVAATTRASVRAAARRAQVHKFSKFIHGSATLLPDLVQAVPYWVDDESVRPSMLQSAPAAPPACAPRPSTPAARRGPEPPGPACASRAQKAAWRRRLRSRGSAQAPARLRACAGLPARAAVVHFVRLSVVPGVCCSRRPRALLLVPPGFARSQLCG